MVRAHDYVVVGGGTTGIVVAARLAAAGAAVCLIEAGPSDRTVAAIGDIRAWESLLGSAVDWDLAAEPLPDGGARVRYGARRVLGGSSSINTAFAFEPPDADLLRWAACGLPDWGPGALVVCCGALNSPLLLMRSGSARRRICA